MSSVTELVRAMNQKAGFELVDQASSPSQLRLLGRVPLDRAGLNLNNWLLVIRQLLLHSPKAAWKADISKNYFLLGKSDKVVYAWRIILQADAIEPHLAEITALVNGSPQSSRSEVTEMPLAGASADRNSTVGGRRGAGPVDRVAIGPMAVAAKQMGM
jgi:hypothetical protein